MNNKYCHRHHRHQYHHYLINETRRKPTTRIRCPTLFDKWHGIVYAQSHRHGWTYQGLWLPSHTDTAGHTKVFDYPVTQTRLGIPRPLITQSHRHGWTYQGLWLPSHTDRAGHTKAFDYPVTQTRLDIPRPLITQSHRHGWTYQGLWLPSHGPLGEVKVLWHETDSNRRPDGPQSNTLTTKRRRLLPHHAYNNFGNR